MSKLALVSPALPGRVAVPQDVQASAHQIHTMSRRLTSAVGSAWTTGPSMAQAEAECLEIARQALGLALAIRKGGA